MILFGIIVLVFLSRMIWSIYSSIIFIKKMRGKRNYKGAILNIAEKVIPERIIEPSTWAVTIILDIGRALLGILIIFLFFIKSKNDNIVLYPEDFLTLFVNFLCINAVWVSGYLFGTLIARAFQNYFSKIRHVTISEQGILYAGRIIVWDHFRGYVVSTERKYIYLLSKYYPTAIGYSFAPTSNQDFNLMIGEIRKYLPSCDFASYAQGTSVFMNIYFQSVFLSIILLLIGLIGLMMPVEIGIILNSLLMYLHTKVSLRIINRIIPTDKLPAAEIE